MKEKKQDCIENEGNGTTYHKKRIGKALHHLKERRNRGKGDVRNGILSFFC
jgi:hypothetical protein